MSMYKLQPRQGTQTFQKITTGRRWVGRVCQHADGHWLGIMGKLMVKAHNPRDAFEEVVARHLGFASAVDLHRTNHQVRAQNNARRQRVRSMTHRFLNGTLQEKMQILDELLPRK